jgi:methylated-DNA-[protein]-cysteine S-methyltransferase
MTSTYATVATPIGDLMLTAGPRGLTGVHLPGRHPDTASAAHDPGAFAGSIGQLGEYFAGERTTFDLALDPRGTPFELRVWRALLEIPYGTTTTYGELARALGTPRGARAVGLANGRNPLAIVVPCHRVIGSDGGLTGYGGGLDRKQALLALEGAWATA